MQRFPRPQKLQLHHDMSKKMEVDQEKLAAMCLYAPALALYTSTTLALHRTSSQSAADRNKGGTQSSRHLEKLWLEFFKNPSQWWDHRSEKANERYPDFKHKITQEALWVEDQRNPPWVAAEIAAMAPGTVQLNILGWNKKLRKYVKDGQAQKAMQLFQQIQQEGMSPDTFTFVQVINACAGLGALEEGRHVHEQIIQSGE
ncbi:unnamed protein product [Sphagnum troendelagicum]